MAKKFLAATALLLCTVMLLPGCKKVGENGEYQQKDPKKPQNLENTADFYATVQEMNGSSVLVTPLLGEDELRSSDQITFGIKDLEDIGASVGDIVKIIYDGQIMETYPAQINVLRWELDDRPVPDITHWGESASPWVDKESADELEQLPFDDIIITEMYDDFFYAYTVIPFPYKIKINGSVKNDWCVGDQVICTCENIFYDKETHHLEADLLTIDIGTFEIDPTICYKPVIYLYPEKETQVSVKLAPDGGLTCTYPAYGDGWNVTAAPDGTLTDSSGQCYNYLYWEGNISAQYDLSHGFCVKGEDTAKFLEQALAELGLNRREANEFIVYWLPLMQGNPYNVIAFQKEAYTDAAKLSVSPAPDTLIRVFMTYKASENYVELNAQELTAPSRTGFTVVEWGGTEITN